MKAEGRKQSLRFEGMRRSSFHDQPPRDPTNKKRRRALPVIAVVVAGLLLMGVLAYIAVRLQPSPLMERGPDAQESAPIQARSAKGVDAAALYQAHCAACHQADANGLQGLFPSLNGSERVNGHPRDLITIVLNGASGGVMPGGAPYPVPMPPFGDKLSDAEIAALLSYLRTSFGNASGPVDESVVRRVRRQPDAVQ